MILKISHKCSIKNNVCMIFEKLKEILENLDICLQAKRMMERSGEEL